MTSLSCIETSVGSCDNDSVNTGYGKEVYCLLHNAQCWMSRMIHLERTSSRFPEKKQRRIRMAPRFGSLGRLHRICTRCKILQKSSLLALITISHLDLSKPNLAMAALPQPDQILHLHNTTSVVERPPPPQLHRCAHNEAKWRIKSRGCKKMYNLPDRVAEKFHGSRHSLDWRGSRQGTSLCPGGERLSGRESLVMEAFISNPGFNA